MIKKLGLSTIGILLVGLAGACGGFDDSADTTPNSGATLQLTVEATVFVEPATVVPEPTLTPMAVSAQDALPRATAEPTATIVVSPTVRPTATPRVPYYTRPTITSDPTAVATPTPDLITIAPPTPRPTVTPTPTALPTSTPQPTPQATSTPTPIPTPAALIPTFHFAEFTPPTEIGEIVQVMVSGAINSSTDWSQIHIYDADFLDDPNLVIDRIDWFGDDQTGGIINVRLTGSLGDNGPYVIEYFGYP